MPSRRCRYRRCETDQPEPSGSQKAARRCQLGNIVLKSQHLAHLRVISMDFKPRESRRRPQKSAHGCNLATKNAAACTGARASSKETAGSGFGSRKISRWSKAATRRVSRAHQAVAEDVAGHIANTHGGEFFALAVVAEFGKVTFDGLPRAAAVMPIALWS